MPGDGIYYSYHSPHTLDVNIFTFVYSLKYTVFELQKQEVLSFVILSLLVS